MWVKFFYPSLFLLAVWVIFWCFPVSFFMSVLWIFLKTLFYRFDFFVSVSVGFSRKAICEESGLGGVFIALIPGLFFLFPVLFYFDKRGDILGVKGMKKTFDAQGGYYEHFFTESFRFLSTDFFLFSVVFCEVLL